MDRRRFIGCVTAGPAAAVLTGCRRVAPSAPAEGCAVAPRERGPGLALDAQQWETLRAACARLLPTDHEPGATEANVVSFVDGQLALPTFENFRSMFAAGLRQLDARARLLGAARFVELPAAKQDDVLRQVQRGVRLGRRGNSKQFFLVLLTLTLEGFLGHPIYGGNRDLVGWRFAGFDPRPPHPRCPYRSPT